MPAKFETARGTVYPWHADHVGHMNVQFYVARFDEASWQLLANFGVTGTYLRENRRGMGALEQHTYYRREVLPGALIRITSEVEEVKPKVVRFTHRMYDVETGEEVASTTITAAHMDVVARRAVPFPDDVAARLTAAISG